MHIHCPHCRSPIEVVDDQELRDVTCPICGSSFNLLPDETVTRIAKEHKTLGHFELLDRIGVGAFGEVWTAHDAELDRTVAIKLPRKGQLSAEEAESFLREARSAARLNHPSIVAVHEVGRADDQLFIVSDYVRGMTLADWLTGKRPTAKEAAVLVAQLADAVQHAHEHGVIHRDLKPSNIMLDDDGQPHIMDFGLAKRDAGEITMTMDGKVLGTPAYMSPEQAKGEAHDADSRTDVYSLGVILFELLTGELPFRGNPRMMLHQVLNDEAPSPRSLNGSIPRDVETICLKCLEKQPVKRYTTARALAEDLRHYLGGEGIEARRITRLGHVWRWCKRNPVVSGLSIGVAMALLGGFLGVAFLWVRAEHHRVRAETEAKRADDEAEQNRRLLYVSNMNLASQAWHDSNLSVVRQILERYRSARQPDLRGFEWYCLWRTWTETTDVPRLKIWEPGPIAFSPKDPNLLAVNHTYGAVTVWDVAARKQLDTLRQDNRNKWDIPFVAFVPNSNTLLFRSSDPARVQLRDLDSQRDVALDAKEDNFESVSLSPDGSLLVSACGKRVTVWNLKTLQKEQSFSVISASVRTLAVSPDGKGVCLGMSDGTLECRDLEGGSPRALSPHGKLIWSLAFSPDGKTLASASSDHTVKLHDLVTNQVRTLVGHTDEVRKVEFSPDGKTLGSASLDGTVRLWDAATGSSNRTLPGYCGVEYSMAFSPDGRTLAFGAQDSSIMLWRMDTPQDSDVIQCGGNVRKLAVTPDGGTLVIMHASPGRITLYNLETRGTQMLLGENHNIPLESIAVSPHRILAVASRTGVSLWDLAHGTLLGAVDTEPPQWSTAVAFSHDGKSLAVGRQDGNVIVWDVVSRQRLFERAAHAFAVRDIAFGPDDKTLFSGSSDGTAKQWDLGTQPEPRVFEGHQGVISSLAIAPRGDLLASASHDGTIRLWNLSGEGQDVAALKGHSWFVFAVAFFSNGTTLVSGAGDGKVILWDVASKQRLCTLRGHSQAVSCVALSPDEQTLFSGSRDGTVRMWRAATKEDAKAAGW